MISMPCGHFKFAATDYILKPVDIEELQAAVERVVEKRKNENTDPAEQTETVGRIDQEYP